MPCLPPTAVPYKSNGKKGTVHDPAACIRRFLKTHHLPSLATYRNVLNLPAIGTNILIFPSQSPTE